MCFFPCDKAYTTNWIYVCDWFHPKDLLRQRLLARHQNAATLEVCRLPSKYSHQT
jgi:hypothetical protein